MQLSGQSTQSTKFWNLWVVVAVVVFLTALWWFYCQQTGLGAGRVNSVWGWLYYKLVYEPQTEMDYAWLVPVLSVFMLFSRRSQILGATNYVDWRGLIITLIGCLIYVVAFRVLQPRVAVFSFPFVVWGAVWYLAGAQIGKICSVPILFLWLMMPLIPFQEYTVGLQLIATQLGQWGAALFGVDTYVQGTSICSTAGNWDAYSITGGCSGMRSLMALVIIAIAWAYMAHISWWKKLLFVAASVPIAVMGNGFRLVSIFVLADYVDPSFASSTWHDWSGLLFFFPCSLFCMMLLHSWMEGELPQWLKRKKSVIVVHNQKKGSATV